MEFFALSPLFSILSVGKSMTNHTILPLGCHKLQLTPPRLNQAIYAAILATYIAVVYY
jgi:hypothetical protein